MFTPCMDMTFITCPACLFNAGGWHHSILVKIIPTSLQVIPAGINELNIKAGLDRQTTGALTSTTASVVANSMQCACWILIMNIDEYYTLQTSHALWDHT